MAFKKIKSSESVPNTPGELFRNLPRRKYPDAMDHQKQIMKRYVDEALNETDVALQLPTGSGKTLVGLLIAEWRRRKYKEKIVYLCPTKQLVNQVVEQAEEKYGISAIPFIGPKDGYSSVDKSRYQSADCIAVTTYSSLFNINPYFNDSDIIILDDAHASENYVSSFWSLEVSRLDSDLISLHTALCGVLKKVIEPSIYARICGEYHDNKDYGWVDKISTIDFFKIKNEIIEIIDAHKDTGNIGFSWSLIRDSIHSCHVYISSNSILIRPLIPPTWTHNPFSSPKQRIYMSATLGAGGDLERLMGKKSIMRLSISGDWDRQGVGRRFFIFPEIAQKDEVKDVKFELIKRAGRSLFLVPDNNLQKETALKVKEDTGFDIFLSDSIEKSKKNFIANEKAVAIMSNRYDGIDFPGEECRLLIIEGLPQATNLQEKFIMSRMGAVALFNERIQTRIMQAIGRCTRSLEDYSAVVILGDKLTDYLTNINKRKYFHPELQAELIFGIEQSKDLDSKGLIENFEIFLQNDEDWENVNKDIVLERDKCKKEEFKSISELENVVGDEINYQYSLWNGDFLSALKSAESIIGKLLSPELKGYRALWHYLAGSAAYLGDKNGLKNLKVKINTHYDIAKKSTLGISWLSCIMSSIECENTGEFASDKAKTEQVENIESILSYLGTSGERKYANFEKDILDGILSEKNFEIAQKKLGELLGFNSGKEESDASPDPWWISGDICFVFEDNVGAKETSIIDASKARQASSHSKWMKANIEYSKDKEIIQILVTPSKKATVGAWPSLSDVYLWNVEDFRAWAKNSLSVMRKLRETFIEPGDLDWRSSAMDIIENNQMDLISLSKIIKDKRAQDVLNKE